MYVFMCVCAVVMLRRDHWRSCVNIARTRRHRHALRSFLFFFSNALNMRVTGGHIGAV
jgi:hypothetical protein